MSFIIFSFNIYFKMAASISKQFASKCLDFQIRLGKRHMYFFVCSFPFNFDRDTSDINIDISDDSLSRSM